MADDDRLRDGELRRQLATLVYSPIRPATAADAAVAVGWWNLLARLGLPVPLLVVHDLGLVIGGATLSGGREVRRDGVPETPLAARYQALLTRMAQSDTIAELAATSLRDDTLAVILARVLGDLYLRWHGRSRLSAVGDLPTSAPAYELDRAELARGHDPAWVLGFVQRLCEQERTVLARLQQIDAGTLRLFGLFPVDGGGADLADLFRVVGTAGAADVVDFSLQLLPSLLETKRRPAAQRFSIDGYASVERRGNLDALLPAELAHDDEVFAIKALSDDLLYYGHERQNEVSRPLHYLLVDGSASMRGAREVFARGLALALAKKLSLVGGRARSGCASSTAGCTRASISARAARRDLPRLLGFRSERGRNYARVFARSGGRGRAAGARRGARGRDHVHHPRRVPDPGRHGEGAAPRRRACTASSCCRRGRWSSTTCRTCTAPGGQRGVAGARRRQATAGAGDRRGRRERLMPKADEIHIRQQADQCAAARATRGEALALYRELLGGTGPRAATTRRGWRGRRCRTWRSAASARRATCCWRCAATRRRSATSPPASGRWSGRSARRAWAATARRRACSRSRATRRWRRWSWRRRGRAPRRAWSGSG